MDIISFLLRNQGESFRTRAALDNLHLGTEIRELLPALSLWFVVASLCQHGISTIQRGWYKPAAFPRKPMEIQVKVMKPGWQPLVCAWHGVLWFTADGFLLAVCIGETYLPSLYIQAVLITMDQDVLEAHRNLGCILCFSTQPLHTEGSKPEWIR